VHVKAMCLPCIYERDVSRSEIKCRGRHIEEVVAQGEGLGRRRGRLPAQGPGGEQVVQRVIIFFLLRRGGRRPGGLECPLPFLFGRDGQDTRRSWALLRQKH
jgi:hypothetical protein